MSVSTPDEHELVAMVPGVPYGDGIVDGGSQETDAVGGRPPRHQAALHLSSVLPALSSAIGHPIPTRVHDDPAGLRSALGLPEVRSAIVVLVDGLGFWNLVSRAGHARYLRSLLNDSANQRPLSTCVPSTTVAAMGVFGTGTCPGLTGMTGYTQRNTDNGRICQLIQFRDAPDPLDLQRVPTVFEGLADEGVRVTSCGMPRFEHSALTRAALRGADYRCGTTAHDRLSAACESARTPGLTYVYIRDVDKTGHAQGWESRDWAATVERIDSQIAYLWRCAPAGTLLVIVADHGMVSAREEDRIDMAARPRLDEGVAMMGGEPRAPMLYLHEDADPADVIGRWKAELGDRIEMMTREQAISRGLYGPVDPRVAPMIGDVVAWSCGHTTIVDSREQTDLATRLPGVHGSRTMIETDVPCLIDVVPRRSR
jgi:hypothetical protein